jgi:two-component system response regulator FixJ
MRATGLILLASNTGAGMPARPRRPCQWFLAVTALPETTVFIVDDDDPVRDSLKMLLESHDLSVRDYASCGDFLKDEGTAAGQGCLLLDMHMPVMDGLTFVRSHGARLRGLPVIMITGRADNITRRRAREAGIAEFLEKPVDDTVLLAAIGRALDGVFAASGGH